MFAKIRSVCRTLTNRARFEHELDDEMRVHIEARADDLLRSGAAKSREEAKRRARMEFGSVEARQDEVRESRGISWFEDVGQDLRFGARVLRKSPGFTIVAVLTLALGIGANTAIFSVVYGVLLRPLPYPQSGRVAQITLSYKGEPDYPGFTAREFEFWKQHDEPFAYLAASHGLGFNLTGGSESLRVRALRVSSHYFDVLGVQPALGRNFSPEEDSPSGPNVVILGYGLWQSHFGGESQLVGKNISLNGTPYTVVGIMPKGFQSISPADLWTTIAQANRTAGSGTNYRLIGRLKDGVTSAQVDAYFGIASPIFLQQFRTNLIGTKARPYVKFHATTLLDVVGHTYRAPLLALFGSIAFVLLIACVNVANLLLARSATRSREIAVRTALGAARARIARQLIAESLQLALIGGVLGLVLARWGLNVMLGLAPADLPRAQEITLDQWALAFSVAASAICGIVFGIAPALRGSKTDLNESLKENVGRATSGTERQRMRGALAAAEIALSVVLLAGASLLIATFTNLLRVNPGFELQRMLSVEIWPTGDELPTTAAMTNFNRNLILRIEQIPGVQAAAIVVGGTPLEQGGNEYFTFADPKQQGVSADYREITPEYFRALSVPVLQGRPFGDSDSANSRNVAIVNEEMAREYFANGGAVGRHVKLEGTIDLEIVGVVGNVRSFLGEPAPPTVFIPDAQSDIGGTKAFLAWFPASVLVRTAQDPLSLSKDVENAIRRTDSAVPLGHIQSLEETFSTSLAFEKFVMTLMSTFAGLALVLAAVGIYGVMAYSVAQRTHEIGIRVALGAGRADVWRMVIGRGMMLTGAGIAAGTLGAWGLTRFLAEELYEVKPSDPVAFAVAAGGLGAVALLACCVPAWKAMRVDPLVALRHE